MRKILWICVAVLALSGCSIRYSATASGSNRTTSSQASVSTGTRLGDAIIIGAALADGIQYYQLGPEGRAPLYGAPPSDPTRKINVQDCSRPIDPDAGNLLCR
jgi:hypothetical protein